MKLWCIKSFDRDERHLPTVERWCALQHQPKGEPRYRDSAKTRCGYYVNFPAGFELVDDAEHFKQATMAAVRKAKWARGVIGGLEWHQDEVA